MQFWIFFQPGMGGDGLANLLEKSPDVSALGPVHSDWRVHRIVDGKIKFFAPTPDRGECFRFNLRPFSALDNELHAQYVQLVSDKKNCVVTSHDITTKNLKSSDCQEILCQDQIRILLVGDAEEAKLQAAKKNLQPGISDFLKGERIDRGNFDLIIDIRELQRDWSVFQQFCQALHIRCDRSYYDQYLDLMGGSTKFLAGNYGVERYKSRYFDSHIAYELIDTWQPPTPPGKADDRGVLL